MAKIKTMVMLAGLLLLTALLAIGTATPTAFSQTGEYRAAFEVTDPPKTGRVGLPLVLPKVTIKNAGTLGWPAGGTNEVRLGYRWFYGYGAAIPKTGETAWEEIRGKLTVDIPVGQSIIFPDFQVRVPNTPGDYTLRLDMVFTTGDRYFQQLGSSDFSLNVSVKARDTTAPSVTMSALPIYSTSTTFPVTWAGKDDNDGSGIATYDIQYKTLTDNNWQSWLNNTPLSTANFSGDNGKVYQFRARARDKSGNQSNFPNNEQTVTRVDSLSPVAKINALPANSAGVFLVNWSGFDDLSGLQLFDVQYREGNGEWLDWIITSASTSGVFNGEAGKTYGFRVRATDYAGNQQEYSNQAQATTTVAAAPSSAYAPPLPPAQPTTGTKTYFFPLAVKNGDNGTGVTGIVVHNSGNAPANIFVRYINREGAPDNTPAGQPLTNDAATAAARVKTETDTIPAGSFKSYWAGDLGIPFYNGWLTVASSSNLVVTGIREAANGRTVTYAASSAATTLYLPYFNKANSTISIANTIPISTEVEIRYYNQQGALVTTDKRQLSRLGSARFSINTPNPSDTFVGSVVLVSRQAIAGSVETILDDGTAFSYPAQTKAEQTPPPLNAYKEVDGFTTTLLLQNPDKDPLNFKVEYINANNAVVGIVEQQLAGFGQVSLWQGNIPGNTFNGKIKITATKPVVAVVVGAGAGYKGRVFP